MPKVDRAVPPLLPALEVAPVKIRVAGPMGVKIRRDHTLFKRRQRDGHLEGRSGRIAPLNGAIIQRTELVAVQRRPGGAVDACGKRIGIVGRKARKCENITVAWIENY